MKLRISNILIALMMLLSLSAVAQTRVRFAVEYIFQAQAPAFHQFLYCIHLIEAVKSVLQGLPHEELHADVVDLFLAFLLSFCLPADLVPLPALLLKP